MHLWLQKNWERVVISLVVIALILTIYTVWRYYSDIVGFPNRFEPCDLTAEYGQVGDFFGGILNPLLSFFSIVLLLWTLSFQIKSNETARDELHAIELESRRRKETKGTDLFVDLVVTISCSVIVHIGRLIFA